MLQTVCATEPKTGRVCCFSLQQGAGLLFVMCDASDHVAVFKQAKVYHKQIDPNSLPTESSTCEPEEKEKTRI
jgi:hypothetical protein